MKHYLNLTKPRISFLFAFTGLTALVMEGNLGARSFQFWMIGLAIFLVGGSANSFNQFFEREVDARMARTAKKRPLPLGLVSPRGAFIFSVMIGLIGLGILCAYESFLAFGLGLATILFYSFYYTLWLKPRTPYNIVIGGAAGATGPLIAWACVSNQLWGIPLVMFLIIFFWTPPHFWSLALCCKEDYKEVGYPMLPLVKGVEETRKQILYYSYSLLPLSLSLYFLKGMGNIYLITSFILGFLFILGALKIRKNPTIKAYWQFFGYSIVYLFLLFTVMIVDVIWG